jgi:hypothetical protein
MSIVGGFSSSKCCDLKEHVAVLVELFDSSIQELNSPVKIAQVGVECERRYFDKDCYMYSLVADQMP